MSEIIEEPYVRYPRYEGPDPLVHILERQNQISTDLLRGQEHLKMPAKELSVFDGTDITKFKTFMLKFERIIEDKCSTDEDRLIYLEQYTAGKAKQLVQSCSHHNATLAFYKAKGLLNEEYANVHKIAACYIEKLHNWPPIKPDDSEGLSAFSLFLIDCNNYLENMSENCSIGSHHEIMNVIMKLPYKYRERWRRHTYNLSRNHLSISFDHLVRFVRDEANIVRQPLFGEITDKKPVEKKKYTTKVKSLITTSKESTVIEKPSDQKYFCYFCKKSNHNISTCKFFERKSFNEKSDFVKANGLCFGCLQKGHRSNSCTNKLNCNTCNRTHPTILHDPKRSRKPDVPKSPENKEESNLTVKTENVQHTKIMYPVIPALIKLPK